MSADKKRYLKVPAVLLDGDHWGVLSLEQLEKPWCMIEDELAMWLDQLRSGTNIGDKVTFEIIELTDAEYEALPDI